MPVALARALLDEWEVEMTRRRPSMWPVIVYVAIWSIATAALWELFGLPYGWGATALKASAGFVSGFFVMVLRSRRWRKQHPLPTQEEILRRMFARWAAEQRQNADFN